MRQKGCASIVFKQGAANLAFSNGRSILDKPNLYFKFIQSKCFYLDLLNVFGVTGFEPMTSCSQNRCATWLRYTPPRRASLMAGNTNRRETSISLDSLLKSSIFVFYCIY